MPSRWFLPVALMAPLLGCAKSPSGASRVPDGPYVLVLGTAQDGGLPQIGCRGPHCTRARRDPSHRRSVTSLLLADPRSGSRWLFDATPDLPHQLELAQGHPPSRKAEGPRPPLFDGIFLTHAHTGHYTGLLHLSREAYGSKQLKVYGTSRMRDFLSANGPWDLMVKGGQIEVVVVTPGVPLKLAEGLTVNAVPVPHRDEYTDTVAYHIQGPERSLLYLPDIDKWDRWSTPVEDWIFRTDYALLDGCFYADGEIPGRSMKDIPHPFIQESLERLGPLTADQKRKVYFTHLNHTNPVANPASPAARAVRRAGMRVLQDGDQFDL